MAKSRPPPKGSSSKPSPGPSSPSTELMARALRAADRATTEVKTEILDQDQLPLDLDDMTVATLDPRRRAKPQASPKKGAAPKKEARQEEDGRQAEVLLKSFLAASRTRDAADEQPEKKKNPPPAKPASPAPPPSAGRMPPAPYLPGAAQAGPRRPPEKGGALHALDQAQLPGVFFNEHPRSPGSEDAEDPALAAAVEEAISVLFGVRGIHHIGPGQNEAGESVVVIAASEGFGEAALQQIPPSVGDFKTLVTLPYELLPLRRSR